VTALHDVIAKTGVVVVAHYAGLTVAQAQDPANQPTKKRVKTASGVIFEITTTKDGSGKETSTITGVFAEVRNSVTGQTVDVPVAVSRNSDSTGLIGATVTGISGSVANLSITPVGASVALTSTQVANNLVTPVGNAIQIAIQSGTLPPTTAPLTITGNSVGSGVVTAAPASTNNPPGGGQNGNGKNGNDQGQNQPNLGNLSRPAAT